MYYNIQLSFLSENTFKSLKVLALNNCNIKSWKEIQLLEPYFPSLEELYLDNNSLIDLPRDLAEQEYRNAIGEEEIKEPKFVGIIFIFKYILSNY